jgi:hypothetical protein
LTGDDAGQSILSIAKDLTLSLTGDDAGQSILSIAKDLVSSA